LTTTTIEYFVFSLILHRDITDYKMMLTDFKTTVWSGCAAWQVHVMEARVINYTYLQ